MLLETIQVNFLAVIIAAAAYFLLGGLWYSPAVFGSEWRKHAGTHADTTFHVGAYIGEFILDLITAYVLAIFIELSRAYDLQEGLVVTFWIWLGFIATTQFSAMIWSKRTFKSFIINAGFYLIGLLVMGAIISLLKDYRFY